MCGKKGVKVINYEKNRVNSRIIALVWVMYESFNKVFPSEVVVFAGWMCEG